VAVRTVSKWERLGAATRPHPDTQAILDTALDLAPEPARIRFQALLAQAPAARWLAASRDWDYESWADDLDRVVVSLSRQDFRAASPLIGRWLSQYPLQRELDDRGAYLRARTLVLHGDARRDQGMLAGPGSAAHAYRQLSEAAQLAAESGLTHQLRAIGTISQATACPAPNRKGITT
jgi:hypothetical protein